MIDVVIPLTIGAAMGFFTSEPMPLSGNGLSSTMDLLGATTFMMKVCAVQKHYVTPSSLARLERRKTVCVY
jgi:hypothetical protein